MEHNKLFRKAAIDKLASPEQLDLLIEVTSARGWLALWTIGAMLFGIVIWSIFGSIPTRVDGEGILIRGGSLRELKATGDGFLTDLSIHINDNVEPGQLIGEVSLPGLEERIRSARLQYESSEEEYATGRIEDEATIAGLEANIGRTQGQLDKVNQELRVKRASYRKGLITKSRVLALERDQAVQRSNITELEARIRAMEQSIRQRRSAADASKREWEELTHSGADNSRIVSPVAARVVELKMNVGDRVRNGDVIAIVEPLSAEMAPVVYVPSTVGKRIREGMEAQISPSTVKREEYGYMKGRVVSVGEFPVTPDAVVSVVANSALVEEFLGNTSKLEVRAELVERTDTPSGYAWSSSNGPPFRIASGTRVTISVVIDRRAPITYVLPILRSSLGLF